MEVRLVVATSHSVLPGGLMAIRIIILDSERTMAYEMQTSWPTMEWRLSQFW